MLFIYFADFLGRKFFWYSSLFWFDMFTHFIGGFWVGLFFIWLLKTRDTKFVSIMKVMSLVLIVGILWEFFQVYTNNYIANQPFDALDVMADVCFDIAGGAFAVGYFFKRRIMKLGVNKVQS